MRLIQFRHLPRQGQYTKARGHRRQTFAGGKKGVTIATNQVCYNLLTRAVEFEVIPFCEKHNIGIIAYSPLLQGLLTDKSAALTSLD